MNVFLFFDAGVNLLRKLSLYKDVNFILRYVKPVYYLFTILDILPRFSDTILMWTPSRWSMPLMTSLTSSIMEEWSWSLFSWNPPKTLDFLIEGSAKKISDSSWLLTTRLSSLVCWHKLSNLADNWFSLTLTWASEFCFSRSRTAWREHS